MSYIVAINNVFSHIVPEGNVLWDGTHFCPASALTPAEAAQFNVFPLAPTTRPPFDPITQSRTEADPALVGGAWTQQWTIAALPSETISANQAAAEYARIASLWQAAHDIEYAQISGSAVGLITIGLVQSKPKCQAVQNWLHSLWALYYVRKASGSTDTDYSSVGACPHSIPEIMSELGM